MAPERLFKLLKYEHIMYIILKHVVWRLRIYNYFREIFKFRDFMNTLRNFAKSVLLIMNILFLTTLPTLKACNSPYMQYYFKWFSVLHSSKVKFSFLIKESRQKAIKTEIVFFIPLGIPRVAHWIISFMLHIFVITSLTN